MTNVAADHLGEWGVLTVDDVATAKLVVAKAVRHGAPMIVNADDPYLARGARGLDRPLTWVGVDESTRVRNGHTSGSASSGDVAWIMEDGWLVRLHGEDAVRLLEADAIPASLGGAAAYNISNALGAAALASALGLSDEKIRTGLTEFDASPEQNPGRGNLFDIEGVRVLVDFVHNPHGFEAMVRTVHRLAPQRVGLMIGHAGDRDDESIRELVRAAWGLAPERVAIKELRNYLRGRAAGEVPAVFREELLALAADERTLSIHEDEVTAARALLDWAREGDFLLLSTLSDRDEVLELVEAARASR